MLEDMFPVNSASNAGICVASVRRKRMDRIMDDESILARAWRNNGSL
jgi:hypothetical protein